MRGETFARGERPIYDQGPEAGLAAKAMDGQGWLDAPPVIHKGRMPRGRPGPWGKGCGPKTSA